MANQQNRKELGVRGEISPKLENGFRGLPLSPPSASARMSEMAERFRAGSGRHPPKFHFHVPFKAALVNPLEA
jgi:hypothetical protein